MREETFEQPTAIEAALRGRAFADEGEARLGIDAVDLSTVARVVLAGCGSSLHAAILGARAVETLARVAASAEIASELSARDAVLDGRTLVVLVSQSGETGDTLAALRRARASGARTLAVVNAPGGSIARESDAAIDVRAGLEQAIPSTKAFSASVAVLTLVAVALGRARGSLDVARARATLHALAAASDLVRAALSLEAAVVAWAAARASMRDLLVVGSRETWPVALEGALKIEEAAYVHAEAIALGELDHGRIALVSPGWPIVVVAHPDAPLEAGRAMDRLVAIGADVAAIVDERAARAVPDGVATFAVPSAPAETCALPAVVVLQHLARALAGAHGIDADRPRHLAKTIPPIAPPDVIERH